MPSRRNTYGFPIANSPGGGISGGPSEVTQASGGTPSAGGIEGATVKAASLPNGGDEVKRDLDYAAFERLYGWNPEEVEQKMLQAWAFWLERTKRDLRSSAGTR